LLGQLTKMRDEENAKVKKIFELRGLFKPGDEYFKNFIAFTLLAANETGGL
jgi:hypothetical protein